MDMAEQAVDDQYDGCIEKMSGLVKSKYLSEERKRGDFNSAWKKAEEWCGKNHPKEKELCTPLYVYTDNPTQIYAHFNRATRDGKTKYIDNTYGWYSLQFLLTHALQTLKKSQKEKCLKTYRGTQKTYTPLALNKEIRLSIFTSTSLNQKQAKAYGSKTCFEYETCYGASIQRYSAFPKEEEVLVPPYEKFKVSKINKPGSWCEIVYELKSSGTKSLLNCAKVKP